MRLGRVAILLGAGVSVDAGLPSSIALTDLIYAELKKPNLEKQSILFGYVVSKLLSRRALLGGSPFDPVNVEEVYDAIHRLLNRNTDPLSEFVQGWDPILEHLRSPFDEEEFSKGLIEAVRDQSRSRSSQVISINTSGLRKAAKAISEATSSSVSGITADHTSNIYIGILVRILSIIRGNTDYIDLLVDFITDKRASVATLNYDMILESSARKKGFEWDYGLSTWEADRSIKIDRNRPTLLKLHGSINWLSDGDIISVKDRPILSDHWSRSAASLIFGGQSSKITTKGPFLQLRHEFYQQLMQSNSLLVIGYSFGDEHVNSILQRWMATRDGAKMVILNPSLVNFSNDIFRGTYALEGQNIRKKVDVVHVKQGAAAGMRKALNEAIKRPELSHDKSKSGLLPHIMIRIVN